ncbi:MAG: hypothetical protein WCT18_02905 [Patescibacteria group bacterium]
MLKAVVVCFFRDPNRQKEMEKLGFTVGEKIDNLLTEITFPPTWTRQTDEAKETDRFFDEKNRHRGNFYFENGHLIAVFLHSIIFCEDTVPRSDEEFTAGYPCCYQVFKEQTIPIHKSTIATIKSGEDNFSKMEKIEKEASQWIKQNYPESNNPFAYWE